MSNQLMIPGIIDHRADNEIISQRVTDGYINATAMCKAAGKNWSDYIRLSTTAPFICELSNATGVAQGALVNQIGLAESRGNTRIQGTWVHPQVAVHLAQWLSPKFAVLVSQWVAEWMSGGHRSYNMPYHLRRYMANVHNVPYGYFSILNEVTLHLIGPMESLGYIVSSTQVVDISVGKMFSKHLRDKGYCVDDYPTYKHLYEDGRIVYPRAYPNDLLGDIRKFFVENWLKERARDYFAERDPAALPYLNEFLALPNYREAMGYLDSGSETNAVK